MAADAAFGGLSSLHAPPQFFAKSIHVRVGVADLTVSQMRLVLGRLARTQPDAVAKATAEVIGLVHRSETRKRDALRRAAASRKKRRSEGPDRPAPEGGKGGTHDEGQEDAAAMEKVSAGDMGASGEEGFTDADALMASDGAPIDETAFVPDIGDDDDTDDEDTLTGRPRWDANFSLLREYTMNYGTTRVSKVSHPRLATWMEKQRRQFRKWKSDTTPAGKGGRPSSTGRMTDRKAELLESVGMDQEIGIGQKWNRNFEALGLYKAETGDTRVPRSYGKLGIWVMSQRAQYWKHERGEKSLLTDERILKLRDIGFDWGNGKPDKGGASNAAEAEDNKA